MNHPRPCAQRTPVISLIGLRPLVLVGAVTRDYVLS
jgi:hypothetical protein